MYITVFVILCTLSVSFLTCLSNQFKIWSEFANLIQVKWYFVSLYCSIYWIAHIYILLVILPILSCTSFYKCIGNSCETGWGRVKFTHLPKGRLKCLPKSELWWASFLVNVLRTAPKKTSRIQVWGKMGEIRWLKMRAGWIWNEGWVAGEEKLVLSRMHPSTKLCWHRAA